jgi:alpha-tubulin suppressor-like RCC1 family protein
LKGERVHGTLSALERSSFAVGLLFLASCSTLKDGKELASGAPNGSAGSSTVASSSTTGASSTVTGSDMPDASTVGTSSTTGNGGSGGGSPSDARDEEVGAGGAPRGSDVEGGSGGVSQLSVAGAFACALLQHGGVRCWGWGKYGVLGYGNEDDIGDDETPASVGDVNVGGRVTLISSRGNHTCALLEGGRVRCWGLGIEAALGYGNIDSIGDNETPASAGDVDVGGKVVQIASGQQHTCALLETGAVRCWGTGGFGELGYANMNNIGDDETPSRAGDVNVGGRVVEIAAGGNNTCARLDSGAVRCWGACPYGQCGYGNTKDIGDDESPAWAGNIDLGGLATQITMASQSVCAVLSGGRLRCWGMAGNGTLGYGNIDTIGDNEAPSKAGDVDVGGKVTLVRCGEGHCCAVLEGGTLRCWGRNDYGQLGYGHTRDIGDDETPASAGDVHVGGTVIDVQLGQATTCALLTGGRVRCWGSSVFGKLGHGHLFGGSIGDDEFPESIGDVPVF